MRGHFKHLRFKNFLMVSWGPDLVFFSFQLRLWTFITLTRMQLPKWECIWESLGFIPYILPHLWECVSHLNTLSNSWALTLHTLNKSNVRVATFNQLSKKAKELKHWGKHGPKSWIFHKKVEKTYKSLQEIGRKSSQTKIWENIEFINITKVNCHQRNKKNQMNISK